MYLHRRRTEPGPVSEHVDLGNVLARLDAVVDRLEGVYDRLMPPPREDGNGRTEDTDT